MRIGSVWLNWKDREPTFVLPSDSECKAINAQLVERCLCAAVRVSDGQIIRGHRHDDAILTCLKKGLSPAGHVQGFLTSYGRFVDRREGMALQKAAGIESTTGYRGDVLFSEDLY